MLELTTPAKAQLLLLAAMRVHARRSLGDVEGHEFHGNQWTSGAGVNDADVADASIAWASKAYPKADLTEKRATGLEPRQEFYKGEVDGLRVSTDIPNTSSIGATFNHEGEYDELPGIREVAIKDLDLGDFHAADDNRRVKDLAEQIKESGEIKPLIVIVDGTKKPYVLEGGHRAPALQLLGKTKLPAVVIVDHTAQKMRSAGDVEGHEFHGNQWTSGMGGGKYPSDLKKIGAAKGSNPGGLHEDASGQKFYVKQYGKPEQAASEHVANQIYEAVGAKVPETSLGPNGELASKWLPDAGKTLGQTGLTKENANAILDHYAADVFTANWDAVGTGHDNILVGKNNEVTRVDQGGTLLYRAQGGLKPEAGLGKVGEWKTLADPSMNHYYAQVFKAAGVKGPDDLGSRAVKQIDRIVAARPSGGWKSFVEKAAPHAPKGFASKVGAMLESRQKGLEEKRAELKLRGLAEWNEEDHPRGPDGKFGNTGGEKGKKAPKAPPVPMELKHKAYAMVKGGKSFKATAAELGMTQGQVAGHVWKVDQKAKAIEESLKEKPAEAPVVYPIVNPPGGYSQYGSVYDKSGNSVGKVDPSVPGGWTPHVSSSTKPETTGVLGTQFDKTGSAVKEHGVTISATGEKVKTDPSTGHIVVSKDGQTANYQWTEKTKSNSPYAEDNLGKYAYFKDGVQVSGAFPKSEHAEAAGSINQGKGPSVGAIASVAAPYQKVQDDFVAHVESGKAPAGGSWPIGNDVTRTEGSNYPKQMDKIGNAWSDQLTTKETSAIRAYTGSSYHGVNVALRNGSPTSASASAKAIESGLAKAPSPPPPELVWRGVSHTGADKLVKGLSNGDVIKLPGFQSTSINPQFAHSWSSGGTVFEIRPNAGAYVKVISSHAHEHEYLIPHNARYAIRGITKVNLAGHKERTIVKLEMLSGH